MKVSYNWLKTLVDVPESPEELAAEFIRTGTEVESIDTVGEAFDHVVTAQVVSKEPHPDSDHMWVCRVDVGRFNLGEDGGPEPLQIVCGAQNFEQGDHIVTALVGAELPGGVKIKKSKLRGVVSCGMNCSARELGLSGDHSGIMILPKDAPVGVPFAEYHARPIPCSTARSRRTARIAFPWWVSHARWARFSTATRTSSCLLSNTRIRRCMWTTSLTCASTTPSSAAAIPHAWCAG